MTKDVAPAIETQPTNQYTTVGQTATFTVTANGTTPLQYQWSENGSAIPGANAASYTTPPVLADESGASYAVTVTNVIGAATSRPAVLTIGPREPESGDWRFQGMDLPAATSEVASGVDGMEETFFLGAIGTPILIGVAPGICVGGDAKDCSWLFNVFDQPAGVSGMDVYYWSDLVTNLAADLKSIATPNIVVTGFDLQPANGVFAVSWLQTSGASGFSLNTQLVAPQDLQSVASQLGQQSQVITALSFNAGQVQLLSYGWQGDTNTSYDVQVVTATSDTFIAEATNLATEGYLITAVGGDPTDGLVLVGTRVQGDSDPRPIQFVGATGTQGGPLNSNLQPLLHEIFNYSPDYEVWIEEQ